MAIAQSTPAKTKKMTVASVLKQIETEKIRWIDLQFVDVLGALQHITIPATSLGNEEFKRGIGKLDGSSIKGFKEIHESDMVMNPDPSTFAVLPWYEGEHRTARFIVDVYEGGSHERFTRDSRYMAQKAAQFAADQGYDTTYWGQRGHVSVSDEDGRPQDGDDGHVHAEADLRRQRERDARSPEPLDERQEHDVRSERRVRGD